MWQIIRFYIRGLYRICNGILGFIYDVSRFVRYGGWPGNMYDLEQRNYNTVMVYHGLEKSLSYKERNSSSGWRNAFLLVELLKVAKASGEIGYHDIVSRKVLDEFIGLPENKKNPKSIAIKRELENINFETNEKHGVVEHSYGDFAKGILENPEIFFNSRYSLREFRDEIVPDDAIKRAVNLAMKTPSACNRQAWGIYHTSNNDLKNLILKYQEGNRPFGEKIPNLLVVTSDLKAFFGGNEHYQHLIDGGLLSMSLMYAFHSIGVATCALNWTQSPLNDLALRKVINIKSNHTIVLILAVGYPNENNKVCVSERRPIDEVFFEMERRS